MGRIGQYLLSIVAAGVIVSIANTLIDLKGLMGAILKLLTGLVLSIVIISPWTDFRIDDLQFLYSHIQADASVFVEEGQTAALHEISQLIQSQVQTYILDKAASFGLKPTIEIQTEGSPPTIRKITITGAASPYAKQRLNQIIREDLGVSEENVVWK